MFIDLTRLNFGLYVMWNLQETRGKVEHHGFIM